MKPEITPKNVFSARIVRSLVILAVFASAMASSLHAQTPQLSLADLIIGLRSQKVTLPERNRILAEAVIERGITFVATPEIEAELKATGAADELIAAIRTKSLAVEVRPEPEPDQDFYHRRAIENSAKGEFELALADFDKAAELKADDPMVLIGRGRTYFNLKAYDRSVADFDRAIELSPRESSAFYNRGVSYERMGQMEKAKADYKTAVELDESNEPAKASLKRIVDAEAAAEAKRREAERLNAERKRADAEAAKTAEPAVPEFISVGVLSSERAVRMVMPVYSNIARRSNIEGRVAVEVELDEQGNVVAAKAISGPKMLQDAAEEAARKSRFHPAEFNGQPIKAKGTIVYNFSLRPGRE